jgi:hypothetical protein
MLVPGTVFQQLKLPYKHSPFPLTFYFLLFTISGKQLKTGSLWFLLLFVMLLFFTI